MRLRLPENKGFLYLENLFTIGLRHTLGVDFSVLESFPIGQNQTQYDAISENETEKRYRSIKKFVVNPNIL